MESSGQILGFLEVLLDLACLQLLFLVPVTHSGIKTRETQGMASRASGGTGFSFMVLPSATMRERTLGPDSTRASFLRRCWSIRSGRLYKVRKFHKRLEGILTLTSVTGSFGRSCEAPSPWCKRPEWETLMSTEWVNDGG
jgi:hypothetical protein